MTKPKCEFGKEVTFEDMLARAKWEGEQAEELEITKPCVGWEALRDAHMRTAEAYADKAVEIGYTPDPNGPAPGSWADVARMMAMGDDSGFDWDAWKDEMKETDGQGY